MRHGLPEKFEMTENKSLKARVRARMAHTGETYTTAHRHVVAARPNDPALPGVVPGYSGFAAYRHRPSALAARLVSQAGGDLSETLACGLGGGIGFMYAVFEYKQVDHPLLTVVAQHHPQPWLGAVCSHLGVEVLSQHSSSPRAALQKLDTALVEGRAAELLVSRGALPWHPESDPVEAAEPYPILVVGSRDETFLVDDLPGEVATIDREALARAWAAHRKGRHQMTTVAPVPDQVDVPQGVRRALVTTTDHLTGPVLGNSFDVNFGLSGMAKLAGDLRDTRTRSGWVRRFGEPARTRYAAARLAECLTTSYTADGATRPLYAEFLREAAAVTTAPGLTEAADAVDASGREWTTLADLARTVADGKHPAPPDVVFAEMAGHVEASAVHEEHAVALVRASLEP